MMALDHADIRAIVSMVLAEQQEQIKVAVETSVSAALVSFGIHEDERKEMRADFIHLRKWRQSVEHAQGWVAKSILVTIASGLAAAFWLGFKAYLGK